MWEEGKLKKKAHFQQRKSKQRVGQKRKKGSEKRTLKKRNKRVKHK
jgi:hypothetical protein